MNLTFPRSERLSGPIDQRSELRHSRRSARVRQEELLGMANHQEPTPHPPRSSFSPSRFRKQCFSARKLWIYEYKYKRKIVIEKLFETRIRGIPYSEHVNSAVGYASWSVMHSWNSFRRLVCWLVFSLRVRFMSCANLYESATLEKRTDTDSFFVYRSRTSRRNSAFLRGLRISEHRADGFSGIRIPVRNASWHKLAHLCVINF